jgi:hypothetical protein
MKTEFEPGKYQLFVEDSRNIVQSCDTAQIVQKTYISKFVVFLSFYKFVFFSNVKNLLFTSFTSWCCYCGKYQNTFLMLTLPVFYIIAVMCTYNNHFRNFALVNHWTFQKYNHRISVWKAAKMLWNLEFEWVHWLFLVFRPAESKKYFMEDSSNGFVSSP